MAPPAAVAALYAVNRVLLIPASGGPLRRFLAWYFADLLAGALLVMLLDWLLERCGRPPVRRLLPATVFLLACGLFWEYVTPLYLPRAVSDPRDLAAYWAGGMTWLLWRRVSKG